MKIPCLCSSNSGLTNPGRLGAIPAVCPSAPIPNTAILFLYRECSIVRTHHIHEHILLLIRHSGSNDFARIRFFIQGIYQHRMKLIPRISRYRKSPYLYHEFITFVAFSLRIVLYHPTPQEQFSHQL
jgi:hypothetical protein